MIQSIIYDGDICTENTTELFKKLDDLVLLKVTNPDLPLEVVLYYSSEGGSCYCAEYQAHYLNRCLKHFPIEIVTGSIIMSAAVDVLMDFKGKITVAPLTMGMVHKSSTRVDTREISQNLSYDKLTIQRLNNSNNRFIKDLAPHFTTKEINLYKEGKEIYIYGARLKNLLNNVKPIAKKKPIAPKKTTKAKITNKTK